MTPPAGTGERIYKKHGAISYRFIYQWRRENSIYSAGGIVGSGDAGLAEYHTDALNPESLILFSSAEWCDNSFMYSDISEFLKIPSYPIQRTKIQLTKSTIKVVKISHDIGGS